MSGTAVFPLPFDATPQDLENAKREFAKHAQIIGTEERAIKFAGEQIGQTGPVWHFQYTRLYRLANGYLAAARDIHEGVKVAFTQKLEELPEVLSTNPVVREFIEDELRYRKVVGSAHGTE